MDRWTKGRMEEGVSNVGTKRQTDIRMEEESYDEAEGKGTTREYELTEGGFTVEEGQNEPRTKGGETQLRRNGGAEAKGGIKPEGSQRDKQGGTND